MSSNKYYSEWEKNNSNYSHKKESYHQLVINKLEKDIKRLDRAIDKIETENYAKKIFSLGKPLYPVYHTPGGTQYIIINGCLVMYQNSF